MAYVTPEGMIDRFGADELKRITDRNRTGEIDAQVLNQAISDAQSEVDAYISSKYSTPLMTVSDAISRTTADIARYRLYDERCPDNIRERYREAIAFLQAVSAGKATLGNGPDGERASGAGHLQSARSSEQRTFSLKKLEGF